MSLLAVASPIAPPLAPAPAAPAAAAPDEPPEIAAAREGLRQRVAARLAAPALQAAPAWPALTMVRVDDSAGAFCSVYEPCVALILQGAKRVAFGSDVLHYDPRRYLIASMDLPVLSTVLEASPARPYLALVLRLDLHELAGMMVDARLPAPPAAGAADGRALATGAVTPALLQAFGRLLDLLEQPRDLPVLGPLVQREILYRLLVGEAGARLRQIASVDTQGHQIARAIDALRTRYAEPLRVEALAQSVRMSVSSFHHHFKALTAMSPLQFQKQLRLTEARRLMLAEHLDAATAAYRVGYESASQFSREYARRYGAPPMRDIAGLRQRQGLAA
ncbi:AraC family transcriptional regulator [Piscinibacter sakaiensis]|uniref:Transcriptional regulator, AraC family n=2 Tax=Piscinibacter sakaiensis TaxID=1547922 RepID=A0A0K8P220_PISS1|nr:AraC family transcriptional regulator [Piscinibacter sakaiensis]GAP36676.1 transcriptional regulator, AraC family [Piscinibacter sakaiensis]